eukprot:gene222-833_t
MEPNSNAWLFFTLLFAIICSSFGVNYVKVSIPGLGQCQGTQESTVAGNVDVFKGIPFAKPPVGALRFQAPQDTTWTGLFNATKFGHVCQQFDDLVLKMNIGNEDCLALNIYRPRNATGQLPVMVWIHGGGYTTGAGSLYDGSTLTALHNVIVVTINYRLGALGFLNIPGTDLKGNYGMLDQVHALRWVKKNIRSFRGNSAKVTIFGESAGAGSVSLLTVSPLIRNEGLFLRAISQSGVATAPWAAGQGKNDKEGMKFAKLLGCSEKSSLKACLQKSDGMKIVDKQWGFRSTHLLRPVVDDYFLKELPSKQAKSGTLQFCVNEIMLGFNKDEGTMFAGNPRNATKQTMAKMAGPTLQSFGYDRNAKLVESAAMFEYSKYAIANSAMDWYYSTADFLGDVMFVKDVKQFPNSIVNNNGKKVHMYHFVYLPANLRYPFMKVSHAVEIDFVFGSPVSGRASFLLGNITEQDKTLARTMMEMWTNFAKTGNPGKNWPEYTASEKKYLEIGANLTVKKSYMTKRDAFWHEFVPTIENATLTAKPCKKTTIHNFQIVAGSFNVILVIKNSFFNVFVQVLGNHDFDGGPEHVVKYLRLLNTSVVMSNVETKDEPLWPKTRLYSDSLVFAIGKEKIGICGYVLKATSRVSSPGPNIKFTDEIPAVRACAKRLTSAGINKIIALGHSGIDMDKRIAKEVDDVDIVVGKPPSNDVPYGPYPLIFKRKTGEHTLVVQDFAFGKYLGSLSVTFDDKGILRTWDGNPILLDNSVDQDPRIIAKLNAMRGPVDKIGKVKIGRTRVFLDGERASCRLRDCALGNLITDAAVYDSALNNNNNSRWTTASIALWTSNSIMASIDINKTDLIRYEDVKNSFPYMNKLDLVELKGSVLLEVLEKSASNYDAKKPSGSFLQVSGLVITYDITKPVGQRVNRVEVRCADCRTPKYEKLNKDKVYKVVVSSYMAKGGAGYEMLRTKRTGHTKGTTIDIHAIVTYIKARTPLIIETGARINIIDSKKPGINFAQTICPRFLTWVSFVIAPIMFIIW